MNDNSDYHHEEYHQGIANEFPPNRCYWKVNLFARKLKCHYCKATFREKYYRLRHERDFHGEQHG